MTSMIDLFSQKMPLSVLLRGLLGRCFSAQRLDQLFDNHASEQYTRHLTFSTVCHLLLNVVLRVHPSAHAAYQTDKDNLKVSIAALYDKLQGIEAHVSAALVNETAQDLLDILDQLAVPMEPWLPGYPIRILDGNCLEASEKRLQVLRELSSAPLPGKSLVVLAPERQLIPHVFPYEDGYAQERALLSAVIPVVQPGELWIADRNFCTRQFLKGLHERGAFALLRLHSQLPYTEQTPLTVVAQTEEGQRLLEQKVLVDERSYRRIRVELVEPTRDGDLFVDLITSLPDEIPAIRVAQLYRKRWTVETAFQQLEKNYHSEINTLAYPRAALFGFCLAVVAYNICSVMLAALDSAHQKPVSETVSTYYISHNLAATFFALLQLCEDRDWQFLDSYSAAQFAQWLREVASHVKLATLKKHPRGPKKPRTKPPYDPKNPHVSTYRLLQGRATIKE